MSQLSIPIMVKLKVMVPSDLEMGGSAALEEWDGTIVG